MSDRESCTHHFEHVKQTLPFTEREYMQCTKCGLQNPLGLFQTVDFSQPGTPVYATKPGHVQATGWNINPGRSWNPALGQYPPWYAIRGGKIRTCKVWKTNIGRYKFLELYWRWKCRLCNFQGSLPTWELAYATANHHARNHHRS